MALDPVATVVCKYLYMSVEHRRQIERILYKIVDDCQHRADQRYGSAGNRKYIYTIGYLIGVVSQLAADDSQVESQLYRLLRRLE